MSQPPPQDRPQLDSPERRARYHLIIPGASGETRYPIETREVTVGSSPRNAISLHHGSVAEQHCRFEAREDGLWLVDLGSPRGTRVGEQVIGSCRLEGGEEVFVGEVRLTLEHSAEPETVPLSGRRESFADTFLKELRRAPWMLTSIAIHALMIYLLWELPFFQRLASEPPPPLQAGLAQFDPDELLEPEPLDEPPLEMEAPEQQLPEPELQESLTKLPESSEPDAAELMGPEDFSGTGASGGPVLGHGAEDLLRGGASEGFGDRVQDLRRRGVEIVFVFDSTSSMTDVLGDVKDSLDRMITILTWIVPHARLGVVTYRDHGDDYVARSLPLTSSRYRILTWVDRIVAAGGADIPEAVYEGLEAAFEEMPWTDGSQHAVILIGDAPPHENSQRRLDEIVARFHRGSRRGAQRVVSTVFTGRVDSSSREDQETRMSFERIAAKGGGMAVNLTDDDEITQQCLTLAFGYEYREDLDRIFSQLNEGGRAQLLRHRLSRGSEADIDWLLAKLHRTPVHPGIVRGLLLYHRRYPKIADELVRNLRRSDVDEEPRWASLYMLRRMYDHDFDFDPTASRYDQQKQIQSISSVIESSRRRGGRRGR